MSDGKGPTATFSAPMGIFYDTNRNECYVADTGNHKIVVCDNRGNFTYEFIHFVSRNGERVPGEPKSLVVNRDGHIFVTDNRATYIDILNYRGDELGRIDAKDDGCGAQHRYDYLAIDADQTVYATLSCKYRRVAVINTDYQVERIVDLIYDDDESVCLTGIAVDKNKNIFVTDPCAPEMVQMFNAKGQFLRGFGLHDGGRQNFSFPAGVALCDNGEMWIVDTIRQVVSRFTASGAFAGYVGGKGKGPGAFEYPSSITTDGSKRFFVLERGGNRYQCFRFELVQEHQDVSTSFTGR
jgi:DNA-binding beta-propeller fold protein YncE